jgi:hypothetical protein
VLRRDSPRAAPIRSACSMLLRNDLSSLPACNAAMTIVLLTKNRQECIPTRQLLSGWNHRTSIRSLLSILEIFLARWQGAAESLGLQVLVLGRSRGRNAYSEQLSRERLHRLLPVALALAPGFPLPCRVSVSHVLHCCCCGFTMRSSRSARRCTEHHP